MTDESNTDANPIVSWSEFSGNRSIFDRLRDISQFALIADTPPTPELGIGDFAQRLGAALYIHMLRAIEVSGFFQEDQLSVVSRPGLAAVVYGDDRYDFQIEVTANSISLIRSGSRLEDFHHWYASIADAIAPLMAGVLDELSKATGRTFTVFRASYVFKLLVHDLVNEDSKRRLRNTELMKRLIRGVPNDAGELANDDDVINSVARADIMTSRWIRNPDGARRLERYSVEAPSNKDGAGLWLSFTYGGDTYTSPTSRHREKFEHRSFFSEHGHAYADFFRDKAILRFLVDLLDGVSFKSSTGSLP